MKKRMKAAACALLAAVLVSGTVHAESLFSGLGQEIDQLSFTPMGVGADQTVVALDDIGISVSVSQYTAIRQEDGFVYIFTQDDRSMPYVIVGSYGYSSDGFVNDFTDFMTEKYPDLRITIQPASITLNNIPFTSITYSYMVSGYSVTDTRLFTALNGFTYMFGAKEVLELGYELPVGFLERTAGSYSMLAGGWDDYANHVDADHSLEGGSADTPGLDNTGGDFLPGPTDGNPEPAPGPGNDEGPTSGPVDPNPMPDDVSGQINFKESVANYNGVWIPFDDGFKLYMPSDWLSYELSQEQKQAGALFLAYDGSRAGNPPYIEVDFGSSEGCSTLDELAAVLTDAGYIVEDKISFNGIPCISYSNPSDDMTGLMFFHPQTTDYIMVVIAGQLSVDEDTLSCILCSLSPN